MKCRAETWRASPGRERRASLRSRQNGDGRALAFGEENMDKISFPYRAATHLNLLYVVGESGSWERFGLDVDYDKPIAKSEAHRAVAAGDVEFVGGNHVSTYGHHARGDSWVYLGQTLNVVHPRLAVKPGSGIKGIADLRGKKVGTKGNHPGLNDWLMLKQRGLDVDRDEVELVRKMDKGSLWKWVQEGLVEAAILQEAPENLFAEAAGLEIVDLDPLPMIWFTTISTSLPFVEKYPDIVERFLKGLIAGIHFFKTQPERSIYIIQRRFTKLGPLSKAQATFVYHQLAPELEPKLYPNMTALSNVYEEAKRADPDAAKIGALELWDLHFVRRLDDSGFVDDLYRGGQPSAATKNAADPEFHKEQAKLRAEVIAAVKACGHLESESCGCD
jgi:ABC-type nitrate/sulfonate/bicarbonate transport system substrate-binding protein